MLLADLALDLLKDMPLLSRDELTSIGHGTAPAGCRDYLSSDHAELVAPKLKSGLLQALNEMQGTFVISTPNADVERDIILDGLQRFTSQHSSARIFRAWAR